MRLKTIRIYFPPFFLKFIKTNMSLIEFEKILSSNTITIEKAKIDNELIRLENKFILDEYDKFKVLTREVLTKKFRVKTIIYPIKKKTI